MPPTSLINITRTPQIPDHLPLYTRDPETSSIRSTAPSYVSAAPSYGSSQAPNHRSTPFATDTVPRTGLPPSHFAPGFNRGPGTGSVGDLENHRFNIAAWNSVSSSHQARHYQNVAHRRATIANDEERISALADLVLPRSPIPASPHALLGDNSLRIDTAEDNGPLNPLEDPDLVGHEAAANTRERRLYMARCNDDEALRQEGEAWDFMLAQMADRRAREKSWEKLRSEVGRSRLVGRRLGLK